MSWSILSGLVVYQIVFLFRFAPVILGGLAALGGSVAEALLISTALAARINRMQVEVKRLNEELQDSYDHLDRKVRERTSELQSVQAELVSSAREAGKVEIATDVLHSVGNGLNSLTVQSALLRQQISASMVGRLEKVYEIVEAEGRQAGTFFAEDPKGPQIVLYFRKLIDHLVDHNGLIKTNIDKMVGALDYVCKTVRAQQRFAKPGEFLEEIAPVMLLIEESLGLAGIQENSEHVKVLRAFDEMPDVMIEGHRVTQILVNLLNNSRQAIAGSETGFGCIEIGLSSIGDDDFSIAIRDDGVGIEAEHMEKIFQHGFTTRSDGHGFGLHASAIAATEMRGSLVAKSDGPGRGACFTLTLPRRRMKPEKVVFSASRRARSGVRSRGA